MSSLSSSSKKKKTNEPWWVEDSNDDAEYNGSHKHQHQRHHRVNNNHNNDYDDDDDEYIRWNCDACTYLNEVHRRDNIARDNNNNDDPTIAFNCKMCCTPYYHVLVPHSTSSKNITNNNSNKKNARTKSSRSRSRISAENTNETKNAEDHSPFNLEDKYNHYTQRKSHLRRSQSNSRSPQQQSRSRSRSKSMYDEKKSTAGSIVTATGAVDVSQWTDTTRSSSTSSSGSNSNSNSSTSVQHYPMSELIKSLSSGTGTGVILPPGLERRVQDFQFAQQKRRDKYGDNQRPWGIYGLYSHLSDIRADLEWAEDAEWRRRRSEPYLSWKDYDQLSHDAKGTGRRLAHRYGTRPVFTYTMMVLCTIMLVVTFGVNGWTFEPVEINPLLGPSQETLIICGARDTNLIVNENQWYRLVTPMFLHAGVIHYVVNMLALFFIGGAVEKAHGFVSTAVFFIIPAVGGNILSAIFLPGFISVGASGGIFGLIGGCMADICLNWNLLFLKTGSANRSSSSSSSSDNDDDDDANASGSNTHRILSRQHFCVLLWLAIDIIINTLIGFTPFVDNFTHLGGFIYGFFIGFASIERLATGFFGVTPSSLQDGGKHRRWSKVKHAIFRYSGLILSVIMIMVTTVILIQSDGVTNPCHGCRYISCVPFPPRADDKWWYCDDCDIVTADLFRSTTTVLDLTANNDGASRSSRIGDDYFSGFATDDDLAITPNLDTARTTTNANANNGDGVLGLYEQVNINCPNGDVEEIDIALDGIYETEEVRRALPSYCRAHCDEVFATTRT